MNAELLNRWFKAFTPSDAYFVIDRVFESLEKKDATKEFLSGCHYLQHALEQGGEPARAAINGLLLGICLSQSFSEGQKISEVLEEAITLNAAINSGKLTTLKSRRGKTFPIDKPPEPRGA